jgi:hypothetical protein
VSGTDQPRGATMSDNAILATWAAFTFAVIFFIIKATP